MAVTEKKRSTILATCAVLVALVAANAAGWFLLRGVRIDATEEGLFTISPGVGELVRALPEPVRIELYWTSEQGADLPAIRSYAQRVREFLEEVVRSGDGMLELRVIDPEPFSEAEDAARAAGIAPRTLDATGRSLMLGLAVRGPTDKVEAIPFLDPSQEGFLEYEVARRIASVGRDRRPVVAVLSTLPEANQFDPRNPMARGGRWLIWEQLDLLFDVRRLDREKPEIPPDAKALLLVQPRRLSEDALRAVDAWVVAGRPLVVFADPWCEADPEARTMDFGSTGAGTTFDLGPLLAQWGVSIDAENVVADLGFATRVFYQTQGGQMMEMSHPCFLTMTKAGLSESDPATSPLAAMNLRSAGAVRRNADARTEVASVLRSTKDVQMVQTLKLGFFGEVDRLVRDFQSLGEPVDLAVRIRGPVESAYPAADGTRAKGEADVLLVAEADMLTDDSWFRLDPRTGLGTVLADNSAFLVNALELAAGDRMLSTLRSRGRYQRPFDRVEALRKDAESRYLAREQELEDGIRKSEMRINELQRERGGAGAGVDASGMLVLTPEQSAELAKLERASIDARKELREVQRSLRSDIERTGTGLMLLNVVAWPLVVALLATTWISFRYRRQRGA